MRPHNNLAATVAAAIEEDLGQGDITAALLPDSDASATIISREEAVLCGQAWVDEVYRQLEPSIKLHWQKNDGELVSPDEVLCSLSGPVKKLLTGERIALNFLQTLSGTATTVRHYASLLQGTKTQLLDTRKTIPGLRVAQKYAVRCGGGKNHRMGLFDAYLIKENHILASGSIAQAIAAARKNQSQARIEIEVETLQELQLALEHQADIIMLDNFDLKMMAEAVKITGGRAKLEVSGNVNDQMLLQIAATGVDYISVGALTKHVRAIDLSMRLA